VTGDRTVTTVEIAGEEYTIRSEASEEYTLECARLVNETIAQIMARASLVEAHKAAILAALALADQLIQAQHDSDAFRRELAERSSRLLEEVESRISGGDLASGDG
jgi:cell division protein ZapA (FtsZ GTPase activity inhibitor)